MTQSFTVTGMTCANCARHVKDALLALPGVTAAEVDLEGHRATIEAATEIPREKVAAALEEADYGLA
jgi:copper chaperone CopZ